MYYTWHFLCQDLNDARTATHCCAQPSCACVDPGPHYTTLHIIKSLEIPLTLPAQWAWRVQSQDWITLMQPFTQFIYFVLSACKLSNSPSFSLYSFFMLTHVICIILPQYSEKCFERDFYSPVIFLLLTACHTHTSAVLPAWLSFITVVSQWAHASCMHGCQSIKLYENLT